jgi:Flp pilus assembly protein TadB
MTGVAITFTLVLAIVLGAYWAFVVRPEQVSERAIRARLKPQRTQNLRDTLVKARERMSGIGSLDATLARTGNALEPLSDLLARSGLKMTLGTFVLASVFAALVAMAVVSRFVPSGLAMLGAGAAAALLPYAFVKHVAAKRIAVFEEQFPEAVDLIARALRAGHALPTALQMVSDEIPAPVGTEFRLLFDQQNFGMSLPEALKAFGSRIPLLDARFFVTAVLTQREMGGNLSEVLDKLSSVIRDRFKVKRQVRAVSAHGRITGAVLMALPPVTATVLFILSPAHIRLLTDDPLGVQMVVMGVTLQAVGIVWIRRILRVEY